MKRTRTLTEQNSRITSQETMGEDREALPIKVKNMTGCELILVIFQCVLNSTVFSSGLNPEYVNRIGR